MDWERKKWIIGKEAKREGMLDERTKEKSMEKMDESNDKAKAVLKTEREN